MLPCSGMLVARASLLSESEWTMGAFTEDASSKADRFLQGYYQRFRILVGNE